MPRLPRKVCDDKFCQQNKEGVKPGGLSQEWFLYCCTKIKKRKNKKKRGKKRKKRKIKCLKGLSKRVMSKKNERLLLWIGNCE